MPTRDEDDLTAYLGVDPADLAGEPDGPCPPPDDADKANRMLRTMAYLERRMKEVTDLHNADQDRLTRWAAETLRPLAARHERLEAAVAGWGRAVNRDDPKRKTWKLPNGEVSLRRRQPKVDVTIDQEQLALLRKARSEWVREGKLAPVLDSIKRAVLPGERLRDVAAPDGYQAHQAVVPIVGIEGEDDHDEVIPGVIYLVPVEDTVAVKPAR